MAISRAGERMRGDTADDIAAFLEEGHCEYPTHQVVDAQCAGCAGRVFVIELDECATCARRTCVACDLAAYMLDSEEHWPGDDEAEARYFVGCECGSDEFEASVAFSFYDDDAGSDIRWVSIGVRCVNDGLLGVAADWKIGYGPSRHLLGTV